jgi:hypothetical protein
MIRFFEQLVISIYNFLRRPRGKKPDGAGMSLGYPFVEGQTTGQRVTLSQTRRTMHIAVLGKTGSGKSSLLRYLCLQDIAAGRGFLFFDLHGEDTKFLLRAIAAREKELKQHLSDRLIVISPADPGSSVGLNPLEQTEPDFVQIAEFAEILKVRWGLDHFGARTDELLRNSLYVLSANGLTLLELAPLLTDSGFRAHCLKNVPNAEVQQYFEVRYGQASDPMKAVMREPILNKTSAFTADPRFRHIVGQAKSTFSIREAMDQGYILLSATVPDDPGYFGERLSVARTALVRAWKLRSAKLQPNFSSTDILGALFLASQIFNQQPFRGEQRVLVLFSDMRNHTRELNLESRSGVPAVSSLATVPDRVPAKLLHVQVYVLGVDGAGKTAAHWQALEQFWRGYFSESGAALDAFSALRELPVDSGSAMK